MRSTELVLAASGARLKPLLASLVLIAGAASLAACPSDPTGSDDVFEGGKDADGTTGGDDVDATTVPDGTTTAPPDTVEPGECQVPADCGPSGPCADWLCVAEQCTPVPRDAWTWGPRRR